MSELDPLFERAFACAAVTEANAAIAHAREQQGERSRSFEVVVPPDAGFAWLAAEVLPRFVYHAESLGIRPPKYPGIFFTFFVGQELVFVAAAEVMARAAEKLQLTHDEMYRRWGTGEARGPIRLDLEMAPEAEEKRPVLALPMPPGKDA